MIRISPAQVNSNLKSNDHDFLRKRLIIGIFLTERSEYRHFSHERDVSFLIIQKHHIYIGLTFFLQVTTNV
jgi:hypothetical protein